MTIQEQLRALWGNVDSEGPHTGSDDFRNGFMAAVGVITDKLEAAGFAWNASTAADEIDRLDAEVADLKARQFVEAA